MATTLLRGPSARPVEIRDESLKRIVATLEAGPASPEHAAFVERLATAKAKK